MLSPPPRSIMVRSRSAMSSSASSQLTGVSFPEGSRSSGSTTRSGSAAILGYAIPFGQAKPFANGEFLSGPTLTALPSSIVATMPRWPSQMP